MPDYFFLSRTVYLYRKAVGAGDGWGRDEDEDEDEHGDGKMILSCISV